MKYRLKKAIFYSYSLCPDHPEERLINTQPILLTTRKQQLHCFCSTDVETIVWLEVVKIKKDQVLYTLLLFFEVQNEYSWNIPNECIYGFDVA